MERILIEGLAAGTIAVILCTSEIGEPFRNMKWIRRVLACPFCTSFWTSLFFNHTYTVFATMGVANITILLIHWSMTTYETDAETETSPIDAEDGDADEGSSPRSQQTIV